MRVSPCSSTATSTITRSWWPSCHGHRQRVTDDVAQQPPLCPVAAPCPGPFGSCLTARCVHQGVGLLPAPRSAHCHKTCPCLVAVWREGCGEGEVRARTLEAINSGPPLPRMTWRYRASRARDGLNTSTCTSTSLVNELISSLVYFRNATNSEKKNRRLQTSASDFCIFLCNIKQHLKKQVVAWVVSWKALYNSVSNNLSVSQKC